MFRFRDTNNQSNRERLSRIVPRNSRQSFISLPNVPRQRVEVRHRVKMWWEFSCEWMEKSFHHFSSSTEHRRDMRGGGVCSKTRGRFHARSVSKCHK